MILCVHLTVSDFYRSLWKVHVTQNDQLARSLMRVVIVLKALTVQWFCVKLNVWRVLRLRMEERPPIWRVAANILTKQSRTAGKLGGWSKC